MLIPPFNTGQQWEDSRTQLNKLVEAVNALNTLIGDGLVRVHRGPKGYSLSLNMDGVNSRISRPRAVQWGVVAADWQGGAENAVTIHPCANDAGDGVEEGETISLQATTHDHDDLSFVDALEGDIVAYSPYYNSTGARTGVLLNVVHGGRYTNPDALGWDVVDLNVKADTWTRAMEWKANIFGWHCRFVTRIVPDGTLRWWYERPIQCDHAGQTVYVGGETKHSII